MKPTFDRPGISMFWPAAVWGRKSPPSPCESTPGPRSRQTNRAAEGREAAREWCLGRSIPFPRVEVWGPKKLRWNGAF